ncbi:alpha/beta hydrolase [candidate division KSB1 bacterium]
MKDMFLKGKSGKGILLLHGFTGYIDEMEELAKFLNKNGFTVSVPTLPGHNSSVYDLSRYTWQDWFEFVCKKYFELKKEVKKHYIGGLSMGGGMALHYAAHYDTNGVVALASGVRLSDPTVYLTPYVKNIIKFRTKKTASSDISIKNLKRKKKVYKYASLHAVDELRMFFNHLNNDIPEIEQPVLMIHGLKDHTIPFESAVNVYERLSSGYRKFVFLKKSFHLITMDIEKKIVFDETLKFLKRKKY